MTIIPPAIILAGGLGTRLWPITQDLCPKPMVRTPTINGTYVPFISWPLGWLKRQGVDTAVICTGHLGGQIEEHFAVHSLEGMKISTDWQSEAGTGARCLSAFERIDGDIAIVVCGDVLLDFPLLPFARDFARRPGMDALVALVTPPEGIKGNAIADEQGNVVRFDRGGFTGPEAMLEAGVFMLRRTAFSGLDPGNNLSMTRHVYPSLVRAGRMAGKRMTAEFHEIGTPDKYRQFCGLAQHSDPSKGILEAVQ